MAATYGPRLASLLPSLTTARPRDLSLFTAVRLEGHRKTSRRRLATAAAIQPREESHIDSADSISPISPTEDPTKPRLEALRAQEKTQPFSTFLTDTFDRQHDYLRISITEKCNLRCLYCMPEEGVPLSPKRHLLTPHEILYLSSLFVSQGVNKIRLTGGEPTVHPNILQILRDIGSLRSKGLKELALTTNGLTLHRKLDHMVESGVTGINLSLDTLDPFQFEIMTRRRGFEQVMKSIERILDMKRAGARLKLKINAVVIRGLNDAQVMPFVEMTRDKDIEVRFIEYMPFDGNRWSSQKMLSYQEMLAIIRQEYPGVQKVQDHPNDTSKTFQVPGFQGRVGFITSMTEHFCGTCNRLRITSDGNLKVCLFGNAEVSLRDLLRQNFNSGEPIDQEAWEAMRQVEMDRHEGRRAGELGLQGKEAELLEVIGAAVKRKKAQHAGMENLKDMKNRPMILIDPPVTHSAIGRRRPAFRVPLHALSMLPATPPSFTHDMPPAHRAFTTSSFKATSSPTKPTDEAKDGKRLTHLNNKGEAQMVTLPAPHLKPSTTRTAKAISTVVFSNSLAFRLIADTSTNTPSTNNATTVSPDEEKSMAKARAKGDVLATARIAGIMAAKETSRLIPLCHNVPLAGVSVELAVLAPGEPGGNKGVHGGIKIEATVTTHAQTGVEMEALTAASVAALTIYDMCKAVDRGMSITGVRVVEKKGGRSGDWALDEKGALVSSD